MALVFLRTSSGEMKPLVMGNGIVVNENHFTLATENIRHALNKMTWLANGQVYRLYGSLSFFVLRESFELSANRALGPRALTTKTKPEVFS